MLLSQDVLAVVKETLQAADAGVRSDVEQMDQILQQAAGDTRSLIPGGHCGCRDMQHVRRHINEGWKRWAKDMLALFMLSLLVLSIYQLPPLCRSTMQRRH